MFGIKYRLTGLLSLPVFHIKVLQALIQQVYGAPRAPQWFVYDSFVNQIVSTRNFALILFNFKKLPVSYEGRTESHEQLFFALETGRADEGECGGRWNQLLCYP